MKHSLMELGSILQFLENKTIMVTGATGYLAKLFVEKILRVQPKVKKFYLLLRAADSKSAKERLHDEVIGKELFKVLREKHGASLQTFVSEKVTPVPGDVSFEDLGVKDSSLKDEMWREIDILLNFAAATKFYERYDVAIGVNTFGALHVLNFAKKCVKIRMLVHVSTAFVCGGEDVGVIFEDPMSMGKPKKGKNKIDINTEIKTINDKLYDLRLEKVPHREVAIAMKDLGMERGRLHGWPNTYGLTKAMGEMFLDYFNDNLPLLIIRPAMITSTYKEPFPSWIEGLRNVDGFIASHGRGKLKCFISSQHLVADMIPADMVANAIIVAMVANSYKNSGMNNIYHVGSSMRNPVKFTDLMEFSFRYFSQNPLINNDGKPINIGKVTLLTSMASFQTYMAICFKLPLKALLLLNKLSFQKYEDLCMVLDEEIKFLMRLAHIYGPYLFSNKIFDDKNLEKLQIAARETCPEAKAFNFDPESIDWQDYITNVHIPGLVKYVIK